LKILAGKLKLVTMDNDADGSDRICYIGTDNYAAGRMVGRLVREVMPNGGDIAIFVVDRIRKMQGALLGCDRRIDNKPGGRTDFRSNI
jgi:ABC-type sugar transport system substrate-binding protein